MGIYYLISIKLGIMLNKVLYSKICNEENTKYRHAKILGEEIVIIYDGHIILLSILDLKDCRYLDLGVLCIRSKSGFICFWQQLKKKHYTIYLLFRSESSRNLLEVGICDTKGKKVPSEIRDRNC